MNDLVEGLNWRACCVVFRTMKRCPHGQVSLQVMGSRSKMVSSSNGPEKMDKQDLLENHKGFKAVGFFLPREPRDFLDHTVRQDFRGGSRGSAWAWDCIGFTCYIPYKIDFTLRKG